MVTSGLRPGERSVVVLYAFAELCRGKRTAVDASALTLMNVKRFYNTIKGVLESIRATDTWAISTRVGKICSIGLVTQYRTHVTLSCHVRASPPRMHPLGRC